jgi:hypothetical protein
LIAKSLFFNLILKSLKLVQSLISYYKRRQVESKKGVGN